METEAKTLLKALQVEMHDRDLKMQLLESDVLLRDTKILSLQAQVGLCQGTVTEATHVHVSQMDFPLLIE